MAAGGVGTSPSLLPVLLRCGWDRRTDTGNLQAEHSLTCLSGSGCSIGFKTSGRAGLFMATLFFAAPGERDRHDRRGDAPGDVSPAAITGLCLQGSDSSSSALLSLGCRGATWLLPGFALLGPGSSGDPATRDDAARPMASNH